jgi:TM2 domain
MDIPQDPLVQKAYSQLSNEDRMLFESTYKRKAKSVGAAYALWFFFGWHYAYMGQWGTQFLYWFTAAGLGIWAIADLFRIGGLINDHNKDVAINALQQVKTHSSPPVLVGVPINAALQLEQHAQVKHS